MPFTIFITLRIVFLLFLFGVSIYGLMVFSGARSAGKISSPIQRVLLVVSCVWIVVGLLFQSRLLGSPGPDAPQEMSVMSVFFDTSFWGISLPVVAILPVLAGFLGYAKHYGLRLKKFTGELKAIDSDYVKLLEHVSSESWVAEATNFLKEGRERAPIWAKRKFEACAATLNRLQLSLPIESYLARARASLESRRNAHRALRLLGRWLEEWEKTRRHLEELENAVERNQKESFSSMFGKNKLSQKSNDYYLPALNFVWIYPERERPEIWKTANSELIKGNIGGCYKALTQSGEMSDPWKTQWESRRDRIAQELVLLSMEVETFADASKLIDSLRFGVLQSEISQMIAERAPWDSDLRKDAMNRLQRDGQVGRRRVAFIKAKPSQEMVDQVGPNHATKIESERSEAYQLLRGDPHAKEWLEQFKSDPLASLGIQDSETPSEPRPFDTA